MTNSTAPAFGYYIGLAGNDEIRELYRTSASIDLLKSISEKQAISRYAPDKWSIKQVLGHLTDHEIIMTYRALRFSRKDPAILPGYDQDLLVANGHFDELSYEFLLDSFMHARTASNNLIMSLQHYQFELQGTASGQVISVENIFRAIIGHERHHAKILQERYLSGL